MLCLMVTSHCGYSDHVGIKESNTMNHLFLTIMIICTALLLMIIAWVPTTSPLLVIVVYMLGTLVHTIIEYLQG